MKDNKKKVVITGLAVVLAAAMALGGGTYAYLQGTTEDVVNNFKTNKVLVELNETTGKDYNIIPGTTQEKDPKVTVDATVDSYVYVEVTDATKGLVRYTIADGWEKLDGYDNVYYREVKSSNEKQEFYVLKDNKVTYDAALGNDDMLSIPSIGYLKSGVKLSFKAHAIQKNGFADAGAAYKGIPVTVSTGTEFKNALGSVKEGQTIKLEKDISIVHTGTHPDGTYDTYIVTPNCTIDLNGKTLSVTNRKNGDPFSLAANNITLKNGVINLTNQGANYPLYVTSGAKNVVIDGVTVIGGMQVIGNSSATLRNVDITAGDYYDVYLEHNSTVTIESGSFKRSGNNAHIYTAKNTDTVIVNGGLFDGSETPIHAGNGKITVNSGR